MATLLLPEHAETTRPSQGTACLALLCSPIRAADGTWRVLRSEVAAGQSVATVLPERLSVARVIVNGGTVAPEAYDQRPLQDGDEVLVIPQWGIPAAFVPFLIYAGVGLVVSIAATALSYVLFPPPKAHNIQHAPEEPSFSFEGIRTAVGPGAPVPVIYGRQRVGGQLLSSSVDQTLTILDNGTAQRRVRAISTPATLSLLLALGEGPVSAIDTTSVQINGQPVANFPGVEIYTAGGFSPQAPLLAFGETRNTFADGRPIAEALSSITYTTTVPVEAFVLNITFLAGLYAFNPKGEKVDNLVTIQYRWRVIGGSYGDWSAFDVVAARTSMVRFGIRREGLTLARYDIEMQMTNVQSVVNAEWVPTLESVTEIQSNTQSYPHTALLGLRALATDTLQGALPNVTVEVRGRTVRMGNFAGPEFWTDNPAWCVMDFLTSRRYGLAIPDSEIDLGAFQAWAAYCDEMFAGETRHTMNYTLDRDARAQQVLLEMMGGSRTLLFKSEGLWTPRPTRNDLPVQLLSWANCTDVKLTYTRDQERINVMEARFANEEQDYQQDVLTWPTIENWPTELRKTSLEVRGVTKPSRVMRAMQFELNRRRFENLSLEMTCALDAIVLQPHDLFRFSHPLPGWGTSGRIQAGSTTSFLRIDQPVFFGGIQSYIVYVRHDDGTTEVRPVSYPGDVQASTLTLLSPLSQTPAPGTSLWAFGVLLGPADTATKVFRVVRMQRMSDTTIRIQAMIHNPSIYDEPIATPLPVITSLFNPLGPPPPLTSLILTELTRVSPSGTSLRVVNLSWDVGFLGTGYAPYGGALLLRRTVMQSALGGSGVLGTTQAASLQDSADGINNYAPLTQVSGHVLDFDDYTIGTGITYVYRVVPISQRGVPNNAGALEAIIHVAGATTQSYFPGTPQNLRLRLQLPTVTTFEGPDVHLEWEPISDTTLFSETFFVADYIVEVWAPGQLYRLRRTIVAARGVGVTLDYTYTLQMNGEDQVAAGQPGARRDLLFLVWARTNTGLISATPAQLSVINPPPDMGDMIPVVTALATDALITFDQFVEPRDFAQYQVFLDTITPPMAIYEDVAIGFHGFGQAIRQIAPKGLTPGVTYYVYVLPYDTFGPGVPSHIASFVPTGINGEYLDNTPPANPTGLILSQGQAINPDGTVMTWIQATWNANTEADVAHYEVQFFVGTSLVPTSMFVSHPTHSARLENVGGNVTVRVKVLATDKIGNHSGFTAEATITTSADTVPPAAPENLIATGYIRSVALLWTPPEDLDYSHSLVYANQSNDWGSSSIVGTGYSDFIHGALQPDALWYYWLKAVDTSGNVSLATFPASPTGGVSAIADRLTDTFIASIVANKITTGTLTALVSIGVANRLFLDGPQNFLYVTDDNLMTRVLVGKLGPLSTHYGLRVFNAFGATMFHADEGGVTADGIKAGVIQSQHLITGTAVITEGAQIANAVIRNAHVSNLAAEKIVASKIGTGTLDAVLIQLGVVPKLFLDGNNNDIYVYDAQSTPILRAMFGQLGAGVQEFGLRVWGPAGELMWDFSGGATTNGIQTSAVTTPKVAAFAITQSVTFVGAGQVTTGDAYSSAGAVAMGALEAGDRLWILFKGVGQNIGDTAAQLEAVLIDVEGATTLDVSSLKDVGLGSVVLQWVWTAPVAVPSRTFALNFRNAIGTDLVGMSNRSFVITRIQR